MLSPKKVKWRKQQKGRMKGAANRGNKLLMVSIAIQALECGYITNRQIEAARIAISRKTKEVVMFGLKSSLISLLLKNQLKLEWVKVKVLQRSGLL